MSRSVHMAANEVPDDFATRLRAAYKGVVITEKQHVSVHFTDYTRACLEKMQEKLVLSVFDFAYGDTAGIDKNMEDAQLLIRSYGMSYPIYSDAFALKNFVVIVLTHH